MKKMTRLVVGAILLALSGTTAWAAEVDCVKIETKDKVILVCDKPDPPPPPQRDNRI